MPASGDGNLTFFWTNQQSGLHAEFLSAADEASDQVAARRQPFRVRRAAGEVGVLEERRAPKRRASRRVAADRKQLAVHQHGRLLAHAAGQFDTAGVFAALVAIVILAAVLNLAVSYGAAKAMPWQNIDSQREMAV